MGAIIRQHGLDTVLDGGCYSACAGAFVTGVKRNVTQFGLSGMVSMCGHCPLPRSSGCISNSLVDVADA
ncbi:MAG: hypothetical protein PBU96_08530 [Stenotrophomonas geniculata]